MLLLFLKTMQITVMEKKKQAKKENNKKSREIQNETKIESTIIQKK